MKIVPNTNSVIPSSFSLIKIHQKPSTALDKEDGYQRFLDATKLNSIMAPVRMRGLTSSGAIGQCYWNVANLVELFGGKVVLGWSIINNASTIEIVDNELRLVTTINLVGHALWLNDKGKMSDPTAKSWLNVIDLNSNETDYNLTRNNNDVFIKFIPLKTTNENLPYLPYCLDLEKMEDLSGNLVKDWRVYVYDPAQNRRKREINWVKINPSSNDKNFLETTGTLLSRKRNKFLRQHRYKFGRFSEKSLHTGMTIEEIRERRLGFSNSNSSPKSIVKA